MEILYCSLKPNTATRTSARKFCILVGIVEMPVTHTYQKLMTACLVDPLISLKLWYDPHDDDDNSTPIYWLEKMKFSITANIHIQTHKNTRSQIFLWRLFLVEQTNFWELPKSWHLTYWKGWNNMLTQMGKLMKKRANDLILDFSAGFAYKSNSASTV